MIKFLFQLYPEKKKEGRGDTKMTNELGNSKNKTKSTPYKPFPRPTGMC